MFPVYAPLSLRQIANLFLVFPRQYPGKRFRFHFDGDMPIRFGTSVAPNLRIVAPLIRDLGIFKPERSYVNSVVHVKTRQAISATARESMSAAADFEPSL